MGLGGVRTLKNRLRVLRAERRWSQAEVADRLGVSRQTINAVELEKCSPSLPLAFKLARLFDTTVEGVFEYGVGAENERPAQEKGL